MNVHHLRSFLAVARERHFGRAAEQLHLTTSPVSRAVRELEREVGAPLFVRGPREVTLTAAGAALADQGAAVLDAFDALLPAARAAAEVERRVVRLGSTHLTEPELVDAVADALRKALPGREVVVELHAAAELPSMVELGRLDLGVHYLPVDRPSLRSRALVTYRMGVAMSTEDRLAGRSVLAMSDLADRTVLLLSAVPVPAALARLRSQLEERGVRDVRLSLTADVVHLAQQVRRSGDLALSFVDVRTGATRVFYEPGFRVLPVEDGPTISVGVLWRADRESEATIAAVLTEVTERWPHGLPVG